MSVNKRAVHRCLGFIIKMRKRTQITMEKKASFHPFVGSGLILTVSQILALFLAFREKDFLESSTEGGEGILELRKSEKFVKGKNWPEHITDWQQVKDEVFRVTATMGRGKRILIADGNRFARRMLRSLLFSAGFDVDTASDGDVARDILTEKEFDLVVIDIDVPVANIRELYQCVKVEHSNCKVIFMSGSILDSDTQSFLREANRPFLPKPFTVSQLMAVAGWA